MKIIEYEEKYNEQIKDLLVELEEYIISIDKDNLDIISKDYRDKMLEYDLKELKENNGKCYLALEDNEVIGLIMGYLYKYNQEDYLDYKCPKKGYISELIVINKFRSKGIGKELISQIEEYFKSIGCEYSYLSVFAYNNNAIDFYSKAGYHSRMQDMIKKI